MRNTTGIYIHIPFCVRKCRYCAFLSFSSDEDLRRTYADALTEELVLRSRLPGSEKPVDTIYLGGGTPSIMEVSQLDRIMQKVFTCYSVSEDAEITIEANPGTLGRTDREVRIRLSDYRSLGINRLSMGVQSMDDDRLRFLGRIHNSDDVVRDYGIAREAGFDNISLDLMFSIPGETTGQALSDAEEIVRLGPEHISCYSTQIEEGTPFFKMAEEGLITEVPEEEDRKTYHELTAFLRDGGYERYEISNFARVETGGSDPGMYRSSHNSRYWDMSDYIGAGLGASGFVNGVRYRNGTDIGEYINSVSKGVLLTEEEHVNSSFDNISEAVFTGLRTSEGITYSDAAAAYRATGSSMELHGSSDKDLFWTVFADAKEEAARFKEQGLLIIDDRGLRLTDRGIDISNTIMACFV